MKINKKKGPKKIDDRARLLLMAELRAHEPGLEIREAARRALVDEQRLGISDLAESHQRRLERQYRPNAIRYDTIGRRRLKIANLKAGKETTGWSLFPVRKRYVPGGSATILSGATFLYDSEIERTDAKRTKVQVQEAYEYLGAFAHLVETSTTPREVKLCSKEFIRKLEEIAAALRAKAETVAEAGI